MWFRLVKNENTKLLPATEELNEDLLLTRTPILQVRDDSSVAAVTKPSPGWTAAWRRSQQVLPGEKKNGSNHNTSSQFWWTAQTEVKKKGGAAESHTLRERLLRDMKFTWKAGFPTASPLMHTAPHGKLRVKPAQAPLWHRHTLT